MAGSIRQRGRNSWQIRVYAGTDAESGQLKHLTRTVQGSRTQAQRELRSLAAFANVGPSVGARTTLGELFDRWFAANEAGWATTTVRSTWSIIDRQLRPKLGHILVRDLTTVMIDEFYASLRVDGAVEGGPLTPGSVRRIHGVLHRALAQAMRWEWIWSNPAASASPPRREPVEMRPPSPEQVGELLDHVKAHLPLLHLFLILAATTGARRGQLLALKWVDVDFEHESLSFQRSWVEGPKGPVLAPTKTRRSHRVALDPYTQQLLEEQWGRISAVATSDLDAAFVFSHHPVGERPWNPNWVTKQFIRHRRAAGIDHFRLHDLRHFMATQMLGAGVASLSFRLASLTLEHRRLSTFTPMRYPEQMLKLLS